MSGVLQRHAQEGRGPRQDHHAPNSSGALGCSDTQGKRECLGAGAEAEVRVRAGRWRERRRVGLSILAG